MPVLLVLKNSNWTNQTAKPILIHGSSVTFQDGALYSTVNNDGSVGYKGVPSSEWDRSGSPFEYYGAAAIALKGSTIKGHIMTEIVCLIGLHLTVMLKPQQLLTS